MNAGMAKPKLDWIIRTSPMAPDVISSTSFARLRVQAIHEGLAHEGAGLAGRVEHRVGLEGGQRHRLFDQHMLAGLGRLDRPFGVAGMRRRDIDRVDLGVGQQGLGRSAGTPGKSSASRLARIARADRDEPSGPRVRDAGGEGLGDAARPDDAPAHSVQACLPRPQPPPSRGPRPDTSSGSRRPRPPFGRRGPASLGLGMAQAASGAWRLGHELVELGAVLGGPQVVEEAEEGVALLLEPLQRLLAVAVEGGVAGPSGGVAVVVRPQEWQRMRLLQRI